jgi:hypothetical protein
MTPRAIVRWIAPILALCAAAACRDMGPDVTPAHVAITPSAATTLPSGTSAPLTATITNAGGNPVVGQSIAWLSSNPSVALVSATGIVTGARAGEASITASVGSIMSTPVSVTVTPGVATRLVIRLQPTGAKSGAPLTAQPTIEVQDASANLVSSSTATVTAVIATGGGAVTGSTATAAGGVATFTALALSGIIGDRTLTFTAPGMAPVTSTGFALSAGAPARLFIRTQPQGAISNAAFATQPVVELRDDVGNLASSSNASVTAGVGNGTGVLTNKTIQAVNGVAPFVNLTLTGVAGDYTLTFSATGAPTISSASFTLSARP